MSDLHHFFIGADGGACSEVVKSDRLQVLLRPRIDPSVYPTLPEGCLDDLVKRGRFSTLVSRWLDVFPDASPDPRVDFEDWVENAVALSSWLGTENQAGLDLFIQRPKKNPFTEATIEHFAWPADAGGRAGKAGVLASRTVSFNHAAPFVLVGPELKAGDFVTHSAGSILPTLHDYRASERYASNPGFLKNAGRHIELCAYDDGEGGIDPGTDLRAALARMRDAGHGTAVVKLRATKAGIGLISLKDRSDKQIHADLIDSFEWALIAHAGRSDAFVVQARVAMEHEYRLVIVDGRVVAGAGCIEEFTPLDNAGEHFDTRTRRIRGTLGAERTEIEPHPEVVNQYLDAAPRIVEDLISTGASANGDAGMGPKTFVLDLCMVNGKVAVVELNPARNFGLYAMNYEPITAAMKGAADRHLRELDVTRMVTKPVAQPAPQLQPRRARP